MVLSDPPKMVWKVHGAWIDGYDTQNKDENITITKNKSLLLFPCSDYVIPHPVIADMLDVILNILQC